MKKRILFSYILALQVLLANIGFAGYSVPAQDFFPSEEIQSSLPVEVSDTNTVTEVVTKNTPSVVKQSREVIHSDEITLFESPQVQKVEEKVSTNDEKQVNDFVKSLEEALE